ncbi:MAG: porin [Rhodospirillaceae bacterium]|nr:porin [Rhodospirillales bacterium]
MKKVLIASTALVAATLIHTGAAQASDKIKLELGGYSKWWVVAAQQDSDYQRSANGANQRDFNSVDIKGDNEVFFGGSTTLNNGLNVGINIELEAGGTTDNTADTIDKSFVFVEGGFGKVIVGTEANGAALLHVMAPDAAGNTDSEGLLTGGIAIANPGIRNQVTTAIDTDGDAEKITYVSPSFYGLTVGGSYIPNSTQDNRGATNLNTTGANAVTTGEIYGVGGLYAKSFGGVDLKLSGGYVTYDLNTPVNRGTEDGVNEYSTGAQLAYAGFTVGGSYRKIEADRGAAPLDGTVWDAGIQYASGPYAVSFIYFESNQDDAAVAGEDKFTVYQVSGKYSMGPGVDLLASVGHAEYNDETNKTSNGDDNHNKGWAVMTGLSLAF